MQRLIDKLTHWFIDFKYGGEDTYYETPKSVPPGGFYNLVASEMIDGQHMPALDIDVEAELIPSTTEGHYHLLIDCPMSWEDYSKLLTTLAEVGIIEQGYCDASLSHGRSYLRPPGVRKGTDDVVWDLLKVAA